MSPRRIVAGDVRVDARPDMRFARQTSVWHHRRFGIIVDENDQRVDNLSWSEHLKHTRCNRTNRANADAAYAVLVLLGFPLMLLAAFVRFTNCVIAAHRSVLSVRGSLHASDGRHSPTQMTAGRS